MFLKPTAYDFNVWDVPGGAKRKKKAKAQRPQLQRKLTSEWETIGPCFYAISQNDDFCQNEFCLSRVSTIYLLHVVGLGFVKMSVNLIPTIAESIFAIVLNYCHRESSYLLK